MLLLSKILSLLVYPLSLCLLLLVLAMLLRMRGARGRANSLTFLATAWLYFCATEWGATALLTPLEVAYPAFAIPFMGSGSTGKACVQKSFDFIGIEREEEYIEIAKARIEFEQKKKSEKLF